MQIIETGLDELIQNGRVYSCGVYYPRQHPNHWNSEISQEVWRCKYGNSDAIMRCAAIMRRMLESIIQNEETIVTFVPSRSHNEWRSFPRSAAEALAREITETMHADGRTQVTLANLLRYRKMTTKLQHQCRSHRERRENISGCYELSDSTIPAGASIIVIDDVLTSGATIRECQRVLLKAGAFDVRGLVLVRTVGW